MKETANVIRELNESLERGKGAALATIISASGSTPRGIASKMLVYPGGKTVGTVGGGNLEALVVKKALECLEKRESGKFNFTLRDKGNTGMICEGDAEVFIEVFKKPFKVAILGSGHIALELAKVLDAAGYSYIVADDRKEFLNRERYPNASRLVLALPHKALGEIGVDPDTYIVIVTRGHALDKECLSEAMKTGAAYIGMIGSSSKVAKTFEALKKKKQDPYKDKRIFSPIGLDIGGETPGEIAVSIVSEIMKLHYKRSAKHMGKS